MLIVHTRLSVCCCVYVATKKTSKSSEQRWSLMLCTYLLSGLCPHTSSLSGSQLVCSCRCVERYMSDRASAGIRSHESSGLPSPLKLTPSKNSREVEGKTMWNPESLTPGSTSSSQRVESEMQDSLLISLFLSGLQCELTCGIILFNYSPWGTMGI